MTETDCPPSSNDELRAENERLEIELNALRGFAQAVMSEWYDKSLDGGELQELGVMHGLLREVQRAEPCDDPCECIDIYGPNFWPVTCFQRTELLNGLGQDDR